MRFHTYTKGDLRVQILSERIVRIEEAAGGAFTDAPTLLVPDRTVFDGVAVTPVQDGETAVLTTDLFTVRIAGEHATDVEIFLQSDRVFGADTEVHGIYTSLPAPSVTPLAFALADGGIQPAEGGLTYVGSTEEDSGWKRDEHTDIYVLLPLGDAEALRADFVLLTGRTPLSSIKTLGSWWSKWSKYSDEDRYKIFARYRENDLPLDIMVVDTEWKNTSQNGNDGDGTGYIVNTDLFPNMPDFLQKAKEQGILILFNDHTHKTALPITDPEELKWQSAGIRSLMEIGLDGWWYDRNWSFSVKSNYKDVRFSTVGQVLYYDTMRAFHHENKKEHAKRVLMLSNVDWIKHGHITNDPSIIGHRYGVQWTGDIYGHSLQLKREMENMVYGGVSGASPYMSSDLGGFWHNDCISANHYLRWVQYGAFSPTFRIHSTLSSVNDHFPWSYGEATEKVAKKFLHMRYHLLPYLYSAARENYESGMPLFRRLDFHYPEYAESKDNSQYLIGRDLLVAPFWFTAGEGFAPVPESWLTTKDGSPGIRVQYRNYAETTPPDKRFKGMPAIERIDRNIENYWFTSSPGAAVGNDFFSARYEGKITPDVDCYLGQIADDGARVYINGELWLNDMTPSEANTVVNREKALRAGETYDIVMEYYELKGKAVAYLIWEPVVPESTSVRTVFIPDGTWINVFSGEKFVGPKTVTVTGGVDEMPIFVREGAALPTSAVISPLCGADWAELSVQLYGLAPTAFTLYEDDGESEAYLDGIWRKTEVRVCEDGDNFRVEIGAVEGKFTTEYTTRVVKLRIRSDRPILGAVRIPRAEAVPFAEEGASNIADVYEITAAVDMASGASIPVVFA